MRILASFLFATLVLSSCSKEEALAPSEPLGTGKVDLDCPRVGQTSMYEHSFAVCTGAATTFDFLGDTLILSVVEAGNNLYFKEAYTLGSISYGEVEVVTYPIVDKGEYLLLPERDASRLFFFYANDTLWKTPVPDVELERSECSILTIEGEPFIGNDIGYLENYDIGVVRKTNVTTVSCEPFFTLDAFLLYNNHNLEVSHVADYGGFIPQVHAWSRIE